jgi:hypothetical protein
MTAFDHPRRLRLDEADGEAVILGAGLGGEAKLKHLRKA